MALYPERLEQIVSDLANQLQVLVVVSARLQADLAGPGQDAVQLHQAAMAAAATLKQLRPDQHDESESERR
jgi:hypothetical protein